MALNMTKKYTNTEVWEVGTNVAPGTAVRSTTNQPGVTITGSGDYAKNTTVGPYTLSGPAGGVGLKPTKATVATDGAFRFPVVGASAATAGNTPVYITPAGALTLTKGTATNFLFGKIDRFIGEESVTECSVYVGFDGISQVAAP
jgi:hypothetical protein